MKAEAVKQAKERLEYARDAATDMAQAKTSKKFGRLWFEFLTNLDSIYEKLKDGSKNSTKSKPWYGGVKHTRKTDEYLRYLHHARNSDHHGLKTSHAQTLNAPKIRLVNDKSEVEKDEILMKLGTTKSGKPILMSGRFSSRVNLVAVVDERDGSVFPTPKTHLGMKLSDGTIPEFALLAFPYFEEILAEAEGLVE